MEHYQVILAYDGSHYKGFQRQAKVHSVQGVVEAALRKLNWQGKSILAAGRTDTGAHALGQVISFELEWNHEPQDLQQALNNHLPPDIVAKSVKRVNASFHPRYDASWRKYLYRIYCQPVREPLLENYAWRVWPAVDLNTLRDIAHSVIGIHDFSAFGTSPQPGGTTVRSVFESDWIKEEPYFIYMISANAFLYHMVRRVVFMQVKLAQGKLDKADWQHALQAGADKVTKDATERNSFKPKVHGLAPAQGLILAEVHYPPEADRMVEETE